MADQKISELTALTGANVADDDAIAIVDTSATETKKIVFSELKNALDSATGFVRITGDTMTGALDVQSTITADGLTSSAVITAQEGRSNTAGTGQIVIDPDDTTVSAAFRLDQADNKLNIDMTNAGTWQKKLSVYTGGDISFYEDTGTTAKFFWDASAESLGIGTSSPSTRLTVGAGAGSEEIRVDAGAGWADLTLNSNATNGGHIYFNDGSNAGEIFYYHASDYMAFNTAGSEAMRLDNLGTLAVGTAHTNNWATFDGRVRVGARGILATTTASTQIGHNWYYDGGGSTGYKYIDTDYASRMIQANGYVSWELAGSGSQDAEITFDEKMRISSGNLLVGKTSTGIGTVGAELKSTGELLATVSSDACAFLNRKTSDGAIAVFRKDNTTVGSIKSADGVRLIVDSIADGKLSRNGTNVVTWTSDSFRAETDNAYDLGRTANRWKDLYLSGGVKWTEGQVEINSGRLLQRSTGDASGLRFDGSGYTPFKNGSVADGTVDLGYSAGRYNNLYLSGGVYLGGVVGANKLDDYEEGTWTPVLKDGSVGAVINLSASYGYYTKIGRQVTVYGYSNRSDGTAYNSTLLITGLPFTSTNLGGYLSFNGGAWSDKSSATDPIGIIYSDRNTTTAYIKTINQSQVYFLSSDIENTRPIYFSFHYITDS